MHISEANLSRMSEPSCHFLETLRSWGYKSEDTDGNIDPASLDWLFTSSIGPFVDFLCENDPEEEEEPEPEEIRQLEETLMLHQLRKEALVKQKALIRDHLELQKHILSKAEKSSSSSEVVCKSIQQTEASSASKKESDSELLQSVSSLSDLYDMCGQLQWTQEEFRHNATFLSQVRLNPLQQAEEGFIQQVTDYGKKQFFEGIANIAGQDDDDFVLLDISNPKRLSALGEKTKAYMEYSCQFSFLKSMFPCDEKRRIQSSVNAYWRGYILKEIKALIQDTRGRSNRLSVASMTERLKKAVEEAESPGWETPYLEALADLILTKGASYVQPIFTGDYKLKKQRQDYFTAKQDQIIEFLVIQKARNEFLTMAYELEKRDHCTLNNMLNGIHSQLTSEECSHQERMKWMNDTSLSPEQYERATIDSRHKHDLRVYSVLAGSREDRHQPYQQLSALVDEAEDLRQRLESMKASLAQGYACHYEELSELQIEVMRCPSLLSIEKVPRDDLFQQTQASILRAHKMMEKIVQEGRKAMAKKAKVIEQKKRMLGGDSFLRAARAIFRYFLFAPDKMEIISQKISRLTK